MKTFYIGSKINTNIPIKELFFVIEIYDRIKKKYIFNMKLEPVSSTEVTKVFNSRIDISISSANEHQVWIYVYRSWNSSEPQLLLQRNIGSLSAFIHPNSFKQLTPINVKQSHNNTCQVLSGQQMPTVILNIPRRYVFVTSEYPPDHSNDPFQRCVIERELYDRIHGNSYPNQKSTSLCGPAAYFYCLLKERTDLYIKAVRELWEEGQTKIGQLEIKAGDAAKPSNFFEDDGTTPRISGIDWITMGSLRDSENFMWDYDNPTNEIAAISAPWEMHDWLKKSGAKNLQNLTTLTSSNLKNLLEINEYAKKGYRVVQLMSSPNIFNGATTPNFKAHWIVWESPLRHVIDGLPIHSQSRLTDIVDLDLFTWGEVKNLRSWNIYAANISLQKFLNASFGAIVFKGMN
ncbi:hypothetical protein [Wielerella bovis]|uniref:hypothetical protein n=1 Tax=Wielerella bovis TaxID=2917790 RepID=UPI0020191678|nr:hypothetical protein [Wielerella bovis]ULJ59370.1 hypothetical protein MIS44_06570 [Wielerella bovis]